MIKINDLNFSYSKDKKVLNDFATSFTKGRVTSILGRNGSGKSTLLKNINKILNPSGGSIFIDGNDVKNMSSKMIAKEVGFLSQRSEGIDATVLDAVLTGRKPHITFNVSENDIEITKKIIKLMGLKSLACRKTTEISGGELQKVVIARALVQEPRILLLDEPVNHLDMVNQLEVLGLIRDITIDRGLTSVVVMHDINTAIRFSDELIFMKDGCMFEKCSTEEISKDIIKSVFNLDVEIQIYDNKPFIITK
jgi:iron complex transport system ATP-binding protein